MDEEVKNVHIQRYRAGGFFSFDDQVIREDKVAVYIDETHILSAPCLKQGCEKFVYAVLYFELNLLPDKVERIEWKDTTAFVYLLEGTSFERRKHNRDHPITGVVEPLFEPEQILAAVARFQELSPLFEQTGAVHVAAWAENDRIIEWCEDISRRTALDKIIGTILLKRAREAEEGAQTDLGRTYLITSGRISSDIAQRAVEMGIPMMVSVAPPSDKAIELARHYKLTLIGFARPPRFNLYTHPGRLKGSI